MKKLIEALNAEKCFSIAGRPDKRFAESISETFPGVYGSSIYSQDGAVFLLRKNGPEKELLVIRPEGGGAPWAGVSGVNHKEKCADGDYVARICPTDPKNAFSMMAALEFLAPVPLGTRRSFGMGDRLGNATPGHIMAVRDRDCAPVFAQQSIREMDRTGRTPREVMADATWAIFQEGYEKPFGADADHLKNYDDVKTTADAGFTFFTIDPSEHLCFEADALPVAELKTRFASLFDSDVSLKPFLSCYEDKEFKVGGELNIRFSDEELMRCAVKYLPALRHTAGLYNILCGLRGGAGKFDFEMSVDETPFPTTAAEHFFIAHELKRMGTIVTSLAPRYVGEFQKGVDYRGDADAFRKSLREHAAIARELGPYKLSIHSGSDKFSIFPIFNEETGGMLHEKTAGTSYLEAIRTIAAKTPELYREIHRFALQRFEADRASYHVTTDIAAITDIAALPDESLAGLMNDDNARQLLHITYGSALTCKGAGGRFIFRDRIMAALRDHESYYLAALRTHFRRHLDALGIGTSL